MRTRMSWGRSSRPMVEFSAGSGGLWVSGSQRIEYVDGINTSPDGVLEKYNGRCSCFSGPKSSAVENSERSRWTTHASDASLPSVAHPSSPRCLSLPRSLLFPSSCAPHCSPTMRRDVRILLVGDGELDFFLCPMSSCSTRAINIPV